MPAVARCFGVLCFLTSLWVSPPVASAFGPDSEGTAPRDIYPHLVQGQTTEQEDWKAQWALEHASALPLGLEPDEVDRVQNLTHQILSNQQFGAINDGAPSFNPGLGLRQSVLSFQEWLLGVPIWVRWMIIAVCALLLLGIAVHVGYLFWQVLGSRAAPAASTAPPDQPIPQPTESALSRADRAAQACDFPAAFRHLHRHLRDELAQRSLLPYCAEWTNWEYFIALQPLTEQVALVRLFTARCDLVFYGDMPSGADAYRRARGELETFLSSLVTEGAGSLLMNPRARSGTVGREAG